MLGLRNNMPDIKLVKLGDEDHPLLMKKVSELELGVSYPIGSDWFKIDHGQDPLAFFTRLGDVHHLIATKDNQIVGTACGILRQIGPDKYWYLAGLKAGSAKVGVSLASLLMNEGKGLWGAQESKAYAISMNRADGSNPVVRLLGRLVAPALTKVGVLRLYKLSFSLLEVVVKVLNNRGLPVTGLLSLHGVKDIILESTGQAMPLYHIQYGPAAVSGASPADHAGVYMLCAWEDSDLARELDDIEGVGVSTATVVGTGLVQADLDFILTSDI